MFGSEALEIAIGLVLLYLVLALVCTTLVEWIARILALRSNTLHAGIIELLGTDLAGRIYDHPLIRGYARESKHIPTPFNDQPQQPSYIPSHLFALALVDVLPAVAAEATAAEATQDAPQAAPPAAPATVGQLREIVGRLPQSAEDAKRALLPLLNKAGSASAGVDKAREQIEAWFDNAMDRVTGQYIRKAQVISLVVALVLTAIVNADSFAIAKALSKDDELRAAIVALAERTANDPNYQACLGGASDSATEEATSEATEVDAFEVTTYEVAAVPTAEDAIPDAAAAVATPEPTADDATSEPTDAVVSPTPTTSPEECDNDQIQRLEKEMQALGLPLGWSVWTDSDADDDADDTAAANDAEDDKDDNGIFGHVIGDWLMKFIGLLFTAFAVALGAPFWFDVLKRITSVRAAGPPPEKTETARG
jgi:hypothetical protein